MLGPIEGAGGMPALKPLPKPKTSEEKKLFDACREFESVMLGMVFKQMQSSSLSADPLEQSHAYRTFKDMQSDETAKGMAKAGGIGLADSLYRQLYATMDKAAPPRP